MLLIVFITASCGVSQIDCYKSVEEAFPDAILIKKPIGEDWAYIVIDYDSNVYYVETMNIFDTELSQNELIFKIK